jgi:hypothetical protein
MNEKEEIAAEIKKCKYCKMNMDANATVCPTCRRAQSNANNPLLLIPICGLLALGLWLVFSNNAPESVRTIVCEFGIRKGEYCQISTENYEVKIDVFQP